MKGYFIILLASQLLLAVTAYAQECRLPNGWQKLCHNIESRIAQKKLKMRLEESDGQELQDFLRSTKDDLSELSRLQNSLPKTTTELLIAIYKRGLNPKEAELMAQYLYALVEAFQFENPKAFDENTSHIIGRQWHEIDYSGEGMTWQKQQAFYAPYGIYDFKSLKCLRKFFVIESKLPYFIRIYKPANPTPELHR